MQLDGWQIKFLNTKGDKILYCGRQIGKSVVCSIDAIEYAVNHPGETTLIIAPTERQAYALMVKMLDYIGNKDKGMISKGAKKPTQTKLQLINGHTIWCLPTGIAGVGIRFLTIHRLYAEEMSRIPREVFDAVNPMLLTTGGATIGLTTPAGTDTYASDVWNNRNDAFASFTRFSISSEEVAKDRPLSASWTEKQRENMLLFLEREKKRMSIVAYAQEYLGKEMEALKQFFSTELIKKCMILDRSAKHYSAAAGDKFLGVDVAGMGGDETVLISLARIGRERLKQVDMERAKETLTTETTLRIKAANAKWNYKKIYIDDGGLGFGVFSELLSDTDAKGKVVAINNSSRPLDRDEDRKKRILKEDLYTNLKVLMEQGKIELFDDPELFVSLRSVQCEYNDSKLEIFGNYTHIAEALIRAAWCIQDKTLGLWAA